MVQGTPADGSVRVRWSALVVISVGLSALWASAGCSRSGQADSDVENLRAENKRLRDEIEQLRKRGPDSSVPVAQAQSRSGSIVDGSGKAKAFEFIQGLKGQPKVADPRNLVFMLVTKEIGTNFFSVPIKDIASVELGLGKEVNLGRMPVTVATVAGKRETVQVISWWPIEVKWKNEIAINQLPIEQLAGSKILFDR
jgi:hypothetical protein